jgi:TRAP-type C4-dicarboxylate transport system permease small subunit
VDLTRTRLGLDLTVVAYLVGRDFTRSQSGFICALFVVFAVYAVWGVTRYWELVISWQRAFDAALMKASRRAAERVIR